MTDSNMNKNITLRLTEEQRNRIGAIAQGKGHKFQWLMENFLEWYSKTGITPWNQPAPLVKPEGELDLGPPWGSPETEDYDKDPIDKKRPTRYSRPHSDLNKILEHAPKAIADGVCHLLEKLSEEAIRSGENPKTSSLTEEQIEAERQEIEKGLVSGEKHAGLPGAGNQGDKGVGRADRKKRTVRKRA